MSLIWEWDGLFLDFTTMFLLQHLPFDQQFFKGWNLSLFSCSIEFLRRLLNVWFQPRDSYIYKAACWIFYLDRIMWLWVPQNHYQLPQTCFSSMFPTQEIGNGTITDWVTQARKLNILLGAHLSLTPMYNHSQSPGVSFENTYFSPSPLLLFQSISPELWKNLPSETPDIPSLNHSSYNS